MIDLRPLSIASYGQLSIAPVAAMLPAAPFYVAHCSPPSWAHRPNEAGEPPHLSPHSDFNADVECTLGPAMGPMLLPACCTLQNLATFRWGGDGPLAFPDVDPDDPPDWSRRLRPVGRAHRPPWWRILPGSPIGTVSLTPPRPRDSCALTLSLRKGGSNLRSCATPGRAPRGTRPTWRPSGHSCAGPLGTHVPLAPGLGRVRGGSPLSRGGLAVLLPSDLARGAGISRLPPRGLGPRRRQVRGCGGR